MGLAGSRTSIAAAMAPQHRPGLRRHQAFVVVERHRSVVDGGRGDASPGHSKSVDDDLGAGSREPRHIVGVMYDARTTAPRIEQRVDQVMADVSRRSGDEEHASTLGRGHPSLDTDPVLRETRLIPAPLGRQRCSRVEEALDRRLLVVLGPHGVDR